MATKWLSENGLSLLWEKITNLFAKKTDLDSYAKKTDVDGKYLPTSGGTVNGTVTFNETSAMTPAVKIGSKAAIFENTGIDTVTIERLNPWGMADGVFLSFSTKTADTADKNLFRGKAYYADQLSTPRKINGIDFDGTKDIEISVDGDFLPVTGGKLTGKLQVGDNLELRTDNEGGNITITAPAGNKWELDAYNGNFRIYSNVDGTITTPLTLNPTVEQSEFRGNSATATKLKTAVKINGVSFDGSKDITIEGGGASGDYLPLSGGVMTGNISYMSGGEVYTPVTFYPGDQYGGAVLVGAGGRTIIGAGESAYGLYTALGGSPTTEDMWVAADSAVYIVTNCNTIGNRVATTFKEDGCMYLPAKGAIIEQTANGGSWIQARSLATLKNTGVPNTSSFYPSVSMKTPTGNFSIGTLNEALYFSYDTDTNFNAGSNNAKSVSIDSSGNFSGNAASATKLYNTWTINGTNFNGTGSITTANWGTARTLTIGSTGKSVNGSANVSWTLNEIGAAAASHTHAYLSTSGGTVSGNLTVTGSVLFTGAAAHGTSLPSSGSAGQVFFLHS